MFVNTTYLIQLNGGLQILTLFIEHFHTISHTTKRNKITYLIAQLCVPFLCPHNIAFSSHLKKIHNNIFLLESSTNLTVCPLVQYGLSLYVTVQQQCVFEMKNVFSLEVNQAENCLTKVSFFIFIFFYCLPFFCPYISPQPQCQLIVLA